MVISPSGAQSGAKSVERELKRVDNAAANTQRLLKRAFTLIGTAAGVREILNLVDAYTKLQNRIRVVVQNNEILGVVTQRVFDIANRSRIGVAQTAELFSRTALATRDLGVSQQELLGITESMNKAIVLSGASAKEANNGLIQLSQGIASNRLGGDELRAVLEQLPVVADVIAKQLGIARGQLRLFARSGNIDAKTILDAFKNASEGIERSFAKTVPTIGQAIEVARNNLIQFVGELATTSGAATATAQAIAFLARNLELLAKVFAVTVATFGAAKLAPFIREAIAAATAAHELRTAVAAGNAVLLGSAEATRQIAAFETAQAAARVQATAATIASTTAEQARATVTFESTNAARLSAEAELAKAQAIVQSTRSEVAAAEASLARAQADAQVVRLDIERSFLLSQITVAETNLATIRAELTVQTTALAAASARLTVVTEAGNVAAAGRIAQEGQLTLLQAEHAAATNTLASAQARLATAETAAASQATVLGRAATTARGAFSALWATIAANPLGTVLILLTAVGTALFIFRNDIALSGDGFATLGDLTSAYFDLFQGGLESIRSVFGDVFGFIGATIDKVFGDGTAQVDGFLRGIARLADFALGPLTGALAAVITAVSGIGPALADLGVQLLNRILATGQQVVVIFRTTFGIVLDIAERFFRTLVTAFSGLGDAFQAALSGDFAGAASIATAAVSAAFSEATDVVTDIPATFAAELNTALGDVFQVNNPFVGEAKTLGVGIAESFLAGFEGTANLDFVNQLLNDANDKARERREAEARANAALGTRGLALPTVNPAISKITRELQDQQALLSLTGRTNAERKVESDLLKIKNELITQGAAAASQQISQIDQQLSQLRQKQQLEGADVGEIQKQVNVLQTLRQTVQEKTKADVDSFDAVLEGFRQILLVNDGLQAQIEVVEDLRGQQEAMERSTVAADAAFARGVISLDEYERAQRRIAEAGRPPVDQIIRQLQLENDLLSITAATNEEREVAVALEQQRQQLAAQGEVLTPAQEETLRLLIEQNQALARQRDLVESVPLTQAKADEQLVQILYDLTAAYERGELSIEQWVNAAEQANQATLTLVGQTLQDIDNQNQLLSITAATNAERTLTIALLQEEQRLKSQGVVITDTERETLGIAIEQNLALQRQEQLLQSITPTADKVHEQYLQDLADVEGLQIRGALTAQQYAQALEDVTLRAAEAGTTLEDGFTRAGIKITNSIQDMASVTESALTSAFNSAEEALNQFAANGEVSIRELAQSVLADFTSIITHQLIKQGAEGLGIITPQPEAAAAETLNPAAAALTAGATALAPAALSLNSGSAILQTAAATLASVVPGLTAAALQLQTAAASLAAANAAGGIAGGLGGFGAAFDSGVLPFTEIGFAAEGAVARAGQPFIVGEEGRELFVPDSAGTIVPHAATAAALANSIPPSGGSTVVNVPRPQVDVHVENHIDSGRVVAAGLKTRDGQAGFISTASKNRTALRKDLS